MNLKFPFTTISNSFELKNQSQNGIIDQCRRYIDEFPGNKSLLGNVLTINKKDSIFNSECEIQKDKVVVVTETKTGTKFIILTIAVITLLIIILSEDTVYRILISLIFILLSIPYYNALYEENRSILKELMSYDYKLS